MVAELIWREGLQRHVAWLYTPMALPIASAAAPEVMVYDCMDELSQFMHAPPELLELEAALLKRADLVFTGGPSLYRAKQPRHPRVYCFPSRPPISGRRGRARRSARPTTRPRSPVPGSASTASWTSAWTWTCWTRWPPRGRTGRS
jgi:hypothetical protein